MTQVFKARWIVPIAGPPIEHAAMVVEHGRIVELGEAAGLNGTQVLDYGDAIITPGFINPHTHLELTCYQDAVPRGPLWEWFAKLIALRRQPDAAEIEKAGLYKGATLSLQAGVTCIGDISRTGLHVAELASSPIRKVCYVELISGAVMPPNDLASLEETIASMMPRVRADRLMIGLSPHTPYTVLQDELAGCSQLAEKHGLPLTMHALETQEEADWLRGNGAWLSSYLADCDLPTARDVPSGGVMTRLEEAGLLTRRVLLAHMNYADDEEIRRLAQSSVSVVWCPRSHAFFGHVDHPWQKMLDMGLNVCVGTDSLASNQSLSILDELRFVRGAYPDCDYDTLLEMGTIRGAQSMGLDDRLGSLAPGKLADFVVFPLGPSAGEDPRRNLLDSRILPQEVRVDGASVWHAP